MTILARIVEDWIQNTVKQLRLWKNTIVQQQGLKQVSKLVINNSCAMSGDLQSVYGHISVSLELNKYLAFSFGGLTYTYTTMPFCVTTTHRVFTKAMRKVLQNLRVHDINCTSYLDISIEQIQNQEEVKSQMTHTVSLFIRLELTINFHKSMLVPTQNPIYLGIQWDSRKIVTTSTQQKLGLIQASLGSQMQTSENMKMARELASLIVYEFLPQLLIIYALQKIQQANSAALKIIPQQPAPIYIPKLPTMNIVKRINLGQFNLAAKQGQAFKLSQTQLPQGTLEALLISEAENSRDPRQRRCKTMFIED
ncbi:MAG: hypothetical protein EZS28_002044 [Streblomastix strix]|uniref:Reverse transcriptase domain-containing protein n=1 Tax=Streblomastix strix TaxID=222440 RepID=A0A5J4X6N5_9EUKA|nr:MAG: hypothetical protein EZS28_002044 [Streblomastix strix]